MTTELQNEIKPDEQLGVSDPLNSNADVTQGQAGTPPSDPFSTLTSNETIIQNGLIRSGNFVTNSAGWRIQASGNAEFNSGTFRGTLTAASIDIPDTTTANSFHVNSSGDAWWGATALASGVAWVKKDGSAKFTSGTIGGWTLGSTTLVGGNVTLTSTGSITVGTGANQITLNGTNGVISSDGNLWTLNGDGTRVGFDRFTHASTNFEATTRFTSTVVNGGTVVFNTRGCALTTSANLGASASLRWDLVDANTSVFLGSPAFSCRVHLTTRGTTASSFFGMGTVTVGGTGHTYTTNHAGFKILIAASVASLYATQGNGTTETASAALATIAADDVVDLMVKINGTASIDYYYRINGGALSAATNLATNLPSSTVDDIQFSASNDSTASSTVLSIGSSHYAR